MSDLSPKMLLTRDWRHVMELAMLVTVRCSKLHNSDVVICCKWLLQVLSGNRYKSWKVALNSPPTILKMSKMLLTWDWRSLWNSRYLKCYLETVFNPGRFLSILPIHHQQYSKMSKMRLTWGWRSLWNSELQNRDVVICCDWLPSVFSNTVKNFFNSILGKLLF